MNLNDLQIALIDNDTARVHAVIDDIDRRTENEMFRRAGEHFGFATVETGGKRIAYLPEISAALGYADPSGLRKLVERYDLDSVSLGGYGQNVRQFLLETFSIHKQAGHATFVTWPVFLIAGMVATGAKAHPIKRYLLECERTARVGGASLTVAQAREARIANAASVVSMLSKADRIQEPHLRQLALHHINEALDGALRLPEQGLLFDGAAK